MRFQRANLKLKLVNDSTNTMLNDNELATLRNRFKRDAEFLMQTTPTEDEDEKSKLYEFDINTGQQP